MKIPKVSGDPGSVLTPLHCWGDLVAELKQTTGNEYSNKTQQGNMFSADEKHPWEQKVLRDLLFN